MDPANNSNRYRSVLAKVGKKDPCVPFFGVFLKDFVFLNDGPPKILSNGLINFAKLRAIIMKVRTCLCTCLCTCVHTHLSSIYLLESTVVLSK